MLSLRPEFVYIQRRKEGEKRMKNKITLEKKYVERIMPQHDKNKPKCDICQGEHIGERITFKIPSGKGGWRTVEAFNCCPNCTQSKLYMERISDLLQKIKVEEGVTGNVGVATISESDFKKHKNTMDFKLDSDEQCL